MNHRWNIFNGKVLEYNNKTTEHPIILPSRTIRVRTTDGNSPVLYTNYPYLGNTTITRVAGTTDIFDVTPSVPIFEGMFIDSTNLAEVIAGNLNDPLEPGGTASGMFSRCTNLTSVSWLSMSRIDHAGNMFSGCTSLKTVSLYDTGSIVHAEYMFFGCSSLSTVDYFNTSSIVSMESMFENCSSLEAIPLFNLSSCSSTAYMFRASGITTVPLLVTSTVRSMIYMFAECTNLKAVPLFDTSSAVDVNSMFYGCLNVESGALALYQQMSTQVAPPMSYTDCFKNCGANTTTGAAELAQIPTSWGGTMSA
jgi:hypothetical protein